MYPKTKCKAFIGAYKKGYLSKEKDTNPYGDVGQSIGGVTYATAFHRYWNEGRADAEEFKLSWIMWLELNSKEQF